MQGRGSIANARPATIPNTYVLDFTSNVNGRRYSFSIGMPFVPPPEGGYPVLYVLDGYAYFASATEAVRMNGNAPHVLVVGIGYPEDDDFIKSVLTGHQPLSELEEFEPPFWAAFSVERGYDLSLPGTDEELAAEALTERFAFRSERVGGLDHFLETIEAEIKPRVARIASIDRTNQAIFGHSLGGLAVLHALFTEPNAFRTFIAASPSIWWNHRAVLANEVAFVDMVRKGVASPRVLITMGSDEDVISGDAAPTLGLDQNAFTARMQYLRERNGGMVENARELTARLRSVRGSDGYQVEEYAVFPKQGHGISPWPALGRAIQFAFQEKERHP